VHVHRARRPHRPAVVVVAVPVGIQAQPRGGADLDQRERSGEGGEHRQQRAAAGRLVGLGGPREHHGGESLGVVEHPDRQLVDVRRSAVQEL
jgi:hypothetical protein